MSKCIPMLAKIVDSSLWDEPDYVVKVFLTMLMKKDRDHVVRGDAYNIGRWARKDELEVIKALKVLSSPDPRKIEQQMFDGRRLEKVVDGWRILNAEYYHRMMRVEQVREYNKLKQAEYRRAKAEKKLADEAAAAAVAGQENKEGANA